jgi:hypothetical protein
MFSSLLVLLVLLGRDDIGLTGSATARRASLTAQGSASNVHGPSRGGYIAFREL